MTSQTRLEKLLLPNIYIKKLSWASHGYPNSWNSSRHGVESNLRRLHGQATKHPGLKQKTFRSKSGLFKAFLRELKPPDDDDNCAQAVSHAGSVTQYVILSSPYRREPCSS